MINQLTDSLDFHGKALVLRSERQRVIASNIANADTPGYASRDFNFSAALQEATRTGSGTLTSPSHARHIPIKGMEGGPMQLGYAVQTQASLDGNTVDIDRERANFSDNAIRYESTLRFINGNVKTMLSAIQGQ
jgi:flagellar basal-body rod protein FlgB